MKVAMDYHLFETGTDTSELKDAVSQMVANEVYNIFYGLESEGIL